MVLTCAALLGLLVGLRTFTPPAVLWLLRHRSAAAYLLAGLALFEYVLDLNPRAPARTHVFGLAARICSGAFCGWAITSGTGTSIVLAGALLGACGAVAGAYAGLALRLKLAALAGRVPAALLEDVLAIAASVAVVAYV